MISRNTILNCNIEIKTKTWGAWESMNKKITYIGRLATVLLSCAFFSHSANAAFGFMCIIMLNACDISLISEKPAREISGCYRYSSTTYIDTFCINEDNTYLQKRTKNGVETIYNEGKWQPFEYDGDPDQEKYISLDVFDYNKIQNIDDGSTVRKGTFNLYPKIFGSESPSFRVGFAGKYDDYRYRDGLKYIKEIP